MGRIWGKFQRDIRPNRVMGTSHWYRRRDARRGIGNTHFEDCACCAKCAKYAGHIAHRARSSNNIKRERETPINFLIPRLSPVDNRRAAGRGEGQRGGEGECFCVELVSILETRRLDASVSSHIRTARTRRWLAGGREEGERGGGGGAGGGGEGGGREGGENGQDDRERRETYMYGTYRLWAEPRCDGPLCGFLRQISRSYKDTGKQEAASYRASAETRVRECASARARPLNRR